MVCEYISTIRIGLDINNRKALEKCLKHFGFDMTNLQITELEGKTIIKGRDFKLTLREGKQGELEYTGYNTNFAKEFKQRYGVEVAKLNMKKQGFFVKETKVEGKIKLTMTK